MIGINQIRRRRREDGFTLVEVLIAGVVLTVGLLAITGLFATAIGNNGRSRFDSTSTMLAQSVIEQITAVLARGGPASVTDCNGTSHTIKTAVGGSIDTAVTDYSMNFVVCEAGGESGTTGTYDVRWSVAQASSFCSSTSCTYLVTVSARPAATGLKRFAFGLPVIFRTYVGPQ
ncbi:MAG: prepilin-type N-terminal cleavage/methylation domain-containing protein [Terriglobales bacterium]